MLDITIIDNLNTEQREWLSKAIVGLAVADGLVHISEKIYIQAVFKTLEDTLDIQKLIQDLKFYTKPELKILKVERKIAAQILMLLTEMCVMDHRFTQTEADYLVYIGSRLGFALDQVKPLLNWACEMARQAKKSTELFEELCDSTPFYKSYSFS